VENVVSIIKQIADEGVTILLVEQNSKLAFDLVDRVYIMEGGEIVVEEDPEILRTKQGILDKYLGVKGDIASD
jgi:branched-chain amino acid transport system ATP-binding protein